MITFLLYMTIVGGFSAILGCSMPFFTLSDNGYQLGLILSIVGAGVMLLGALCLFFMRSNYY